MTRPPSLSPELLLWEIGAILARHGIAFSTANPSAAVHYADKLLHALGIATSTEPAALLAGATTETLPRIPARDEQVRVPLARPDVAAFARGQHRPGAPRALNIVTSEPMRGGRDGA